MIKKCKSHAKIGECGSPYQEGKMYWGCYYVGLLSKYALESWARNPLRALPSIRIRKSYHGLLLELQLKCYEPMCFNHWMQNTHGLWSISDGKGGFIYAPDYTYFGNEKGIITGAVWKKYELPDLKDIPHIPHINRKLPRVTSSSLIISRFFGTKE